LNLTTVENDIITKLGDIPDIEIRSFPDSPSEYNLVHPGGALLVRYDGSDYQEPDGNNQRFLTQTRLFRWIITIVQKNLSFRNNHHGIYDLIELVRTTLSGYTITSKPDASIMYPIGDRFVSENQGTWIYQMTFLMTHPEHE
jgi:hypothetical protein